MTTTPIDRRTAIIKRTAADRYRDAVKAAQDAYDGYLRSLT